MEEDATRVAMRALVWKEQVASLFMVTHFLPVLQIDNESSHIEPKLVGASERMKKRAKKLKAWKRKNKYHWSSDASPFREPDQSSSRGESSRSPKIRQSSWYRHTYGWLRNT